jgi:hypothetical protein
VREQRGVPRCVHQVLLHTTRRVAPQRLQKKKWSCQVDRQLVRCPHSGTISSWGQYMIGKWPIKRHLRTTEPRSQNVVLIGCQAETVVGLPWAAGSCPWAGCVHPRSTTTPRGGGGGVLPFPLHHLLRALPPTSLAPVPPCPPNRPFLMSPRPPAVPTPHAAARHASQGSVCQPYCINHGFTHG